MTWGIVLSAIVISTLVAIALVVLTRWHEAMLHRPRLSQMDQQQPGHNDPERLRRVAPAGVINNSNHNGANAA